MREFCFVPGCSVKTGGEKIMITVPITREKRERWFKAVGAKYTNARRVCCEDHFNLEEDAENWHYFRFIGAKIKIKPDIVPHLCLDSSSTPAPSKSQLDENLRLEKKERLDNMVAAPEPEIIIVPVDVVPEMMIQHGPPVERNYEYIDDSSSDTADSVDSSCNEYVLVKSKSLESNSDSSAAGDGKKEKKTSKIEKKGLQTPPILEIPNTKRKRKRLRSEQTRRKSARMKLHNAGSTLVPSEPEPESGSSPSLTVRPKRGRKQKLVVLEDEDDPDYLNPADLPPNYVYCSCLTGIEVD